LREVREDGQENREEVRKMLLEQFTDKKGGLT
jgi:hypothetical protein